ncbi:unnamed protein product [Notodromas monacha]|uniref:C2H2-type domain-containing protein n=1 Tax=Notodromas monacha TaxID=399045 RepID=A0A7R9GEF8_9CRUS|nr:unnamed protein product [Notodromas monacha]CAG0919585.1 unnamed protein product [Notodromas monacha]
MAMIDDCSNKGLVYEEVDLDSEVFHIQKFFGSRLISCRYFKCIMGKKSGASFSKHAKTDHATHPKRSLEERQTHGEKPGWGISKFEIGRCVEARDASNAKWLKAEVVDIMRSESLVRIHFLSLSQLFDEWIQVPSPRIRPLKQDAGPSNFVGRMYKENEIVLAPWLNKKRFPAKIVEKLEGNDEEQAVYRVRFEDGFIIDAVGRDIRPMDPRKAKDIVFSKEVVLREEKKLMYEQVDITVAPSREERRQKSKRINISEVLGLKRRSESVSTPLTQNSRLETDELSSGSVIPGRSGNKRGSKRPVRYSPTNSPIPPASNASTDAALSHWGKKPTEAKAFQSASVTKITFPVAEKLVKSETEIDVNIAKHVWQVSVEQSSVVANVSEAVEAAEQAAGPQVRRKSVQPRIRGRYSSYPKPVSAIPAPEVEVAHPSESPKHDMEPDPSFIPGTIPVKAIPDSEEVTPEGNEKPADVEQEEPAKQTIHPSVFVFTPKTKSTKEEKKVVEQKPVAQPQENVCPVESCRKSFRREDLLMMHIKHNHSTLKQVVATPSVSEMAVHIRPSSSPQNASEIDKNVSIEAVIDVEVGKEVGSCIAFVPQTEAAIRSEVPFRFELAFETLLRDCGGKWKLFCLKLALKIQLLAQLKTPPHVSLNRGANAALVEMPSSTTTDVPDASGGKLDSSDVLVEPAPDSSISVDDRQGKKPDVVQVTDDVSLSDAGGTDSMAETDTTTCPSAPSTSATGDVVCCSCRSTASYGLMIQCDSCETWQHGACENLMDDTAVPKHYECNTCRNPRLQRRSMKYTHDESFLKSASLPSFFLGEEVTDESEDDKKRRVAATMKLSKIIGRLLKLRDLEKSVQHKINIAQNPNHPKLVQWAKPWPTIVRAVTSQVDAAPLSIDEMRCIASVIESKLQSNEIQSSDVTESNARDADLDLDITHWLEDQSDVEAVASVSDNAPEFKAPELKRIEPMECQVNLFNHVDDLQTKLQEEYKDVENALDEVEKELALPHLSMKRSNALMKYMASLLDVIEGRE